MTTDQRTTAVASLRKIQRDIDRIANYLNHPNRGDAKSAAALLHAAGIIDVIIDRVAGQLDLTDVITIR